MIVQYQFFMLLSLIAFTANTLTLYFLYKRPAPLTPSKTRLALKIYVWLAFGYLCNNTFEILISELTYALARLDHVFMALLPVAWLNLVYHFCGYEDRATPKRIWLFMVIPTITSLIAVLPPFKSLLWNAYEIVRIGTYSQLKVTEYGAWFWIYALNTFLVYSYGMLLLAISFFKGNEVFKKQAATVLMGLSIPLIVIISFVFRLVPGMQKDFSAIAFAFSGVIFVYGINRYSFLDIRPVARGMLVEDLTDGVIVLDVNGFLVDANKTACKILQVPLSPQGIKKLVDYFPKWQEIIDAHSDEDNFRIDLPIIKEDQEYIYDLQVTNFAEGAGRLVTLHDVTMFRHADKVMRDHQQILEARIKARTQELSNLNATLEQRVINRTRYLASIYAISSMVSESETVDIFLEKALASTLNTLDASVTCVYLLQSNLQDNSHGPNYQLVHSAARSKEMLEKVTQLVEEHDLLSSIGLAGDYELNPNEISSVKDRGEEEIPLILIVPMESNNRTIGALALYREGNQPFSTEDIVLVSTVANQIAVGIVKYQYQREVEAAHLQAERQALAADLHDSISQSLYGVAAFSEAARRHLDNGDVEACRLLVERIDEETRMALKEFRLFIFNLHPADLENLDLVGAINKRLVSVEGRAGLKYSINTHGKLPPLAQEMTNNLYYITLEALNNTMRHASASQVAIDLYPEEKQLRISIRDNGKGFDLAEPREGSYGIKNMKQRINSLGGSLNITSELGSGTEIAVQVPYPFQENNSNQIMPNPGS